MNLEKIFSVAQTRDIAYAYIIKKVAELPTKKERLNVVDSLVEFIQEEHDNMSDLTDTKIYNTGCTSCMGVINEDTGKCLNCGK